ncbi:OmpA family protein [Pelagerythrobacter sp.]|uniref:OmpA family protein n=1 Tax=Pelagerythrobacter sp. TaxID=2800702 RepID=UPI0035ADDF67
MTRAIMGAVAALALAGCQDREETPAPEPSPTASPSPTQASIIRPDVAVERIEPELEPLEASVSFAEAGGELSDAAIADLEAIVASPQTAEGGAIVLRGHTDSVGDDEANLRVSERRAEMVRDWLVEKGVAEDRISVIALGEQRPIAPNAQLDGTPDEGGRAANRRVDVSVALPGGGDPAEATDAAEPQEKTVAEALAGDD